MWGNFLSVGSVTCDSMGRYFIGRYFLCLNLVGRDSLVFFSFAVLFCRIVPFFSVGKFLHDFYNVKYTRILKTRLFLRFRPLSFLFSGRYYFPLLVSPFHFYFPFPPVGPYFFFSPLLSFTVQIKTNK